MMITTTTTPMVTELVIACVDCWCCSHCDRWLKVNAFIMS